ncbi:hypothetical protein T02_2275 [Trichinella nativa]|uniref:Uncharacterized protein n=1 Tax=Trichinella nativa TaxID=6335 RepID=A0A0V1KK40_9BILA|nr:hypothetical protein T02_2275 [Trichinella nativa]
MVCIDENRFVRTLSDASQYQPKIVMALCATPRESNNVPNVNNPSKRQWMLNV